METLLQIITAYWQISAAWAVFLVITAASLVYQKRFSRQLAGWALIPYVFSVSIFLCSAAFENSDGSSGAVTLARLSICLLLLGQLASSVLLVRRFGEASTFVTVIIAGGLWLSAWGSFVGLMSVTGESL